MSVYSAALLLANLLWSSRGSVGALAARLPALLALSPRCWIPITSNALGGIIAGQVIKHVGGVRRSFAVIVGIMLTGVFEWAAFGTSVSSRVWLCLPVMFASIYMYATAAPPPSRKQKAL